MGGKHGGIYIRCDSCGKTIGGEECSEHGLHWSETNKMKAFAISKGWTGNLSRESDNDKCPECSVKSDLDNRTLADCKKRFEGKEPPLPMSESVVIAIDKILSDEGENKWVIVRT